MRDEWTAFIVWILENDTQWQCDYFYLLFTISKNISENKACSLNTACCCLYADKFKHSTTAYIRPPVSVQVTNKAAQWLYVSAPSSTPLTEYTISHTAHLTRHSSYEKACSAVLPLSDYLEPHLRVNSQSSVFPSVSSIPLPLTYLNGKAFTQQSRSHRISMWLIIVRDNYSFYLQC